MAKTVDATTMRQINKKNVIEIIYNRSPISRIDISQITGLNKATISSLVDELISVGFVSEIGFGNSSGGRKPVLLEFNARAGYCIGIDVQITHLTTVLTDMNGSIVYKQIRPIYPAHRRLTPTDVELILTEEIQNAVKKAPSCPLGIIGAGIALPGIVNFQTGSAFYLPNIEIRDWNICAALSRKFSFPVFIDNDGNCGAWSEYLVRHTNNLLFVNLGIGIGTGIVINGKLYRGTHGIAGEYGHTTIFAMGILCACGNYGCWEQYASERALLRYLLEQGEVPDDIKLSREFVSLAVERAADSQVYKRAFMRLGQYLGIGIANIVNGLNPDVVVIGGTLAQGADYFLPEVQSAVKHRAMAFNKQIPITIAHEDTIVLGAARLPISNTILLNPLDEI